MRHTGELDRRAAIRTGIVRAKDVGNAFAQRHRLSSGAPMHRLLPCLCVFFLACDAKDQDTAAGTETEQEDLDGDGYGADTDCDDEDFDTNPGAAEICDGEDNDCDGFVDDQDPDVQPDLSWWPDKDGDGHAAEDSDEALLACEAPEGWVALADDCDDDDAAINPEAEEICDELDNDCDGLTDDEDDSLAGASSWYQDADQDGWGDDDAAQQSCSQPDSGYVSQGGDCDDGDPAFHPGAPEEDCTDPNDYNCDGSTGYDDDDGDGWAACEECDDGDATVNPDADEVCNGIDDDCDDEIDEDALDASSWYADSDGDSYGDLLFSLQACEQPPGYVADATDCDDADAQVNPAATEICDEIDNDCDGTADEDDASEAPTWYADADADSYGDGKTTLVQCDEPSGYVADGSDCDDGDAEVNPAATELCDSIDNDCDGTADEDDSADAPTWYADADSDSYGDDDDSRTSCAQPSGYTALGGDCDETDAAVNPGATELCDEVDNDCDGDTDEDDAADAGTWYADADADSYGDADTSATACDQPSGYVAGDADCDDGDADINPGATEICDGLDNDCDSSADASGLVSWDDGSSVSDVSASFAAGSSGKPVNYAISSDGSLTICDGTYYVYLDVSASDVEIVGLYGSARTILDADSSASVIDVSASAPVLSVSGLSLQNGYASSGGAFHCEDSAAAVSFDDVVFEANGATYGGAIYMAGGELSVTDGEFVDNTALSYGGAAYLSGLEATLDGVEIEACSAAAAGGAIYATSCVLDLDELEVEDSSAAIGGALYAYDSEADLFEGQLHDNASAAGGALYLDSSSLIMETSLLEDNDGTWAGAYSSGLGGGAYLYSSSLICAGSSSDTAGMLGNWASSGGAVYLADNGSTLESKSCDWGVAGTSDDNSPEDINYGQSGGTNKAFDYETDESFACDSSGCS